MSVDQEGYADPQMPYDPGAADIAEGDKEVKRRNIAAEVAVAHSKGSEAEDS